MLVCSFVGIGGCHRNPMTKGTVRDLKADAKIWSLSKELN